MKIYKSLYSICTVILFILFPETTIYAQCTARSIIKNCQSKFEKPYKYSGCWMSEFVLNSKYQRVEGHFVVFEGQQYQILFCSSGSAENVVVNIYDRSAESLKARKLYDSSKHHGCNLWKFEPNKSGDYYIEYIIPPSNSGKPHTGCLMMMIGTIIDTGGE